MVSCGNPLDDNSKLNTESNTHLLGKLTILKTAYPIIITKILYYTDNNSLLGFMMIFGFVLYKLHNKS